MRPPGQEVHALGRDTPESWQLIVVGTVAVALAVALAIRKLRDRKQAPQTTLRFALALTAAQLGELSPSAAADLLTRSTRWWVGTVDEWAPLASRAALTRRDAAPTNTDTLVVVAFDVVLDRPPFGKHAAPTSRPVGAELLRRPELRIKQFEHYALRDLASLTRAGFRA